MIDPHVLLPLWEAHRDALSHPVRTLEFPRFGRTFEDRPYQLGVVNLSRDSSYRESIAHDVEAARYRARRMTLEGAAMVDVGAESTGERADLLDTGAQTATLLPVIRALVDDDILVSAETYHTDVAIAALESGAGVINLTGRVDDVELYEAIARHDAGLILCYTPGETARSADDVPSADVMIDEQMAYFRERLAMIEAAGVERIWIDPGFGFALNLSDGPERIRYQTDNVLQSFRFRSLGWPVCVTMASSVYLFHDEVRSAETGMAALALLAKANLLRSHEVARVQPMLDLLDICGD
ncbi:dihydropteroate synthase [Ilumatobacter sp.]|uniref:dihydropteroate synthase n=1 Tax=Ilumatobacter sp. TaxID=1967498 RepID=UPI003AF718C8